MWILGIGEFTLPEQGGGLWERLLGKRTIIKGGL